MPANRAVRKRRPVFSLGNNSLGVKPPFVNRTFPRKVAPFFLALVSIYPWNVLLSLYALGYRHAMRLGHWPAGYEVLPPATMAADWHYAQVKVGLITSPFVFLLCVGLIIAAQSQWRDFPMWKLLSLAIFSLMSQWIVLKWDPGRLVAWFTVFWW